MVKPNPVREYFLHPAKQGLHTFITTNVLYFISVLLTMVFIAYMNNLVLLYLPSFIIIFWSQFLLRYRKGVWAAFVKAFMAVISFFSVIWLSTGFLLWNYIDLGLGLLGYGALLIQAMKAKRPYDMFHNYFIDPY